jgi:ATP-binding cassette subfamily B protein
MTNTDSFLNLYLKSLKYFNKKQKLSNFYTIFFSVLSSFAELISIGSVVPFLILIINPESVYNSNFYKMFLGDTIIATDKLIFFIFIFFIFLIAISTLLKVIYLKLNCNISYNIIKTFGDILFKKIINKDYQEFNKVNIKDAITTITLRSQSIGEANYNIILIAGSFITTMLLLINIIFFISFKIVIFLFFIFIFYFLFWLIIKKKINNYSEIFSANYQKLNKSVDEMMHSYSELVLYNLNVYFINEFEKNNYFLRKSQSNVTFLGGYPSIVIQMVITLGFVFLIYIWNKNIDFKSQIAFFVLLILTVQRVIPNLQTIFTSYINLSYHKENIKKTLLLLSSNNERKYLNNEFNFNRVSNEKFRKINIKNLKFNYPDMSNNKLLSNINLEIAKGEKVALVGKSGSGKSTLVKIILGFLKPTAGEIFINDKDLNSNLKAWWYLNVAYIPQKIFILDENIYENIALKKNITELEKNFINKILSDLNLSDLGIILKDKSSVFGGEDGKRYSGGQIQRIAIARAIFQKRDFIILDETLNALDNENVVNTLDLLKKIPSLTLLIVAHSENVVKKCDRILSIENGQINEIRSF